MAMGTAKGVVLAIMKGELQGGSTPCWPPSGSALGGIVAALLFTVLATEVLAAPPLPAGEGDGFATRWGRFAVQPGSPVDARPIPPRAGHRRCIGVDNIAGAQLFGDRAIELTMKSGRRYRMFFARECPALSFYQGFYYRRQKTGQLCAGRDSVGARSGGECPIASILPVRRIAR
jgi:hypothetical protein